MKDAQDSVEDSRPTSQNISRLFWEFPFTGSFGDYVNIDRDLHSQCGYGSSWQKSYRSYRCRPGSTTLTRTYRTVLRNKKFKWLRSALPLAPVSRFYKYSISWSITKTKNRQSYLLKNNSLGVGCATEGVGLPPCPEVSFLVVLIGPNLRHR